MRSFSGRGSARRAATVFLLSLNMWACTCAPKYSVGRRHVATLPRAFEKRSIVLADDRADYAYVVRSAEGFQVVHGKREGPIFAEVTQPRFGPGTRKLFYWGTEAEDGKARVKLVTDEQTISTDFARPGTLTFSKAGTRWAAIGGAAPTPDDGRRVEVYADGERVGAYADCSLPAFSPDAAHLSYLVEDEAGRITLITDGREERFFEAPQVPTSPIVRASQFGPNLVAQFGVVYLADGRLIVVAQDREGWGVFRDGTRLASYRTNVNVQGFSDGNLEPVFSSATTLVAGMISTADAAPVAAWWERQAGETERWRVVRDGKPDGVVCVHFWEPEAPVLSADGQHLAYACHTQSPELTDVTYVVRDGRRYGPYASVWGITFSPDGTRFAYAADDGVSDLAWAYYLDGKPRATRYDRVWPMRFSPDGKELAWAAERRGRVILFLDGHSIASSEQVLLAPEFKGNTRLEWVVLRHRKINQIDVTWH